MKQYAALLLCLFFLAQPAHAETVAVRTAQHDSFTRIVLDTRSPSAITVQKIEGKLQINLPPKTKEITTDGFFRRITKDVVADIVKDAAKKELLLRLACDCSFNAFQSGPNMFVIDVAHAAAKDGKQTALGSFTWLSPIKRKTERLSFDDTSVSAQKPEPPALPKTAQEKTPPPVGKTPKPAVFSQTNLAQARLLRSLALENEADLVSKAPVSDRATNQIVFHANGADRANAPIPENKSTKADLKSCQLIETLNPAGWPNYEDPASHLKAVRLVLAQEENAASGRNAQRLAQAYLSVGMGAEAGAILRGGADRSPLTQAFMVLSELVDEQRMPLPAEWLSGFEHCPKAIVWRVLKVFGSEPDAMRGDFSFDEINRARSQFEQWPAQLRSVFSSRFVDALLTLGMSEAAEFTIRRTPSGDSATQENLNLSSARIELENNDASKATSILTKVVEKDGDTAPLALLELAAIADAEGANLNAHQSTALASYQEEHKGTAIEPDLLRARIDDAIRGQDIETAIELFFEYAQLVRPSLANLVADEIGSSIRDLENDGTFLKEVVSLDAKMFARIAQDIQGALKARVEDLGFSDLANQIGKSSAAPQDSEETQTVDLNANGPSAKNAPIAPETQSARDRETTNVTALAQDKVAAADPNVNAPLSPKANTISKSRAALEKASALRQELKAKGL